MTWWVVCKLPRHVTGTSQRIMRTCSILEFTDFGTDPSLHAQLDLFGYSSSFIL